MKKLKGKINVKVEKTSDGFSAYAENYDVFTTASNSTELYSNLIEALNLLLEDAEQFVTKNELQLQFDLKQFFQHYSVLNAVVLAERIGMNPTLLSQYVRGKKIPSKKQLSRIMSGINEIGKELSDLNFTD
ncbi:MAG: helix-turn-helix transcriptional regulator [Flavobacteriales bacterium]|nr:helix-turn-helix transcriptional regulator [Flavobacteriales bacterium]MDG1780889.1 helix-turn-helix transcriptional regulator [Flavobacteriales bacterium]